MSKIHVYVSGPISKGDMFVNVRNAILVAEELRRAGLVPYVPHLSFSWQMLAPVEYEAWMELDFAWVERCDAVLRLPGESSGADREVAHANRLGIPVFCDVASLLQGFEIEEGGRPMDSGRRRDEGLPTGTRCSVCREPQFYSSGGDVCVNGHGGAPALE